MNQESKHLQAKTAKYLEKYLVTCSMGQVEVL